MIEEAAKEVAEHYVMDKSMEVADAAIEKMRDKAAKAKEAAKREAAISAAIRDTEASMARAGAVGAETRAAALEARAAATAARVTAGEAAGGGEILEALVAVDLGEAILAAGAVYLLYKVLFEHTGSAN
ncbi:MAG TPA: hypothetical protein VEI03_15620 [Stellaceae bacterium]|nr:hypothetical protein [Stellaceae bacterium]